MYLLHSVSIPDHNVLYLWNTISGIVRRIFCAICVSISGAGRDSLYPRTGASRR